MSQPEPPSPKLRRLQARHARAQARMAAAQAELHAIAHALSATDGASPFAPESFPALPSIDGVRLAAVEAGVRYADRLDVMLARVDGPETGPSAGAGPSVAGVFTQSGARAAPVLWCEERLAALQAGAAPQSLGILVNAGNANAFTGGAGTDAVARTAAAAAQALSIEPAHMFVASTGVIGEPLPVETITAKLDQLAGALAPDAWEPAARAIMTTDTYPKGDAIRFEVGGATVTVGGLAKGSGMIAPDMATMLAFLFTDADIAPAALQQALSEAVAETFNAITVDGDTSTSDTLLVAATRRAGNPPIPAAEGEDYLEFRRGLTRACRRLALQVVKDGEGISKFVEVQVSGARTRKAAKAVAFAIANSPLVKTAWAGEDPNWGRIVMAIGKSGQPIDRDRITIRYGDHPVAADGWRDPAYDEAALAAYMRGPELTLTVDLGLGGSRFTAYTGDLTHGYISINADYRS